MTLSEFLVILNGQHERLTRQQFKTLRGQALAGNVNGASKGLRQILLGSGRNADKGEKTVQASRMP